MVSVPTKQKEIDPKGIGISRLMCHERNIHGPTVVPVLHKRIKKSINGIGMSINGIVMSYLVGKVRKPIGKDPNVRGLVEGERLREGGQQLRVPPPPSLAGPSRYRKCPIRTVCPLPPRPLRLQAARDPSACTCTFVTWRVWKNSAQDPKSARKHSM
jgi:hypothetical protein